MRILLNVLILTYISNVECFFNVYSKIKTVKYEGDPGQPLILTPLIKAGKIDEAQSASKVMLNDAQNIESYSGFLTVNEEFNSNMFFWFFPSQLDHTKDPVLLWLQGGPGATSLFGLFSENGPFVVTPRLSLKLRKYSWTYSHSVLYIDNPVGTGYSFTDDGGYSQNETIIGDNLYNALLQFFQLFPNLQTNPFYVSGESYGGKYVPAVSYTIHRNNPGAKQKINLQGLAIGNGLSDPINQLRYGEYLYQIGLIDRNTRSVFNQYERKAIEFIKKEQYDKAFRMFDDLLDGDFNNRNSIFKNATGFVNYYNYLVSKGDGIDYMGQYIQRCDVRAAIHVGNSNFSGETRKVERLLRNDIMQSVADWVSELLSHYRVLVYNGQLDIIVAYPLTINYLNHLNFSAANEYKIAKRYQWHVGDELAGYVKMAGNLTEVLVRNAGHMVPKDQPKWAFDLINRFTHHKSFHLIPS